ncbi:prominin-2-like, partial [Mustelus asterias]
GVGFSFIFSWLLILLVFVTFFVGGNVQTLVCKPWKSGEIYKAVDTLVAAYSDLNPSSLLGVQVNFSELHRRCEQGDSLFNFLSTDQKTQLNKALNLSTYTADLEKVEELNVDLGTVVLLDSAGNSTLMDFANSGIDRLNYTQFIEQVQQPIVKMQLLHLADQLDELSSTQDDEVKGNLSGHSADLRELQRTSVSAIEQELATLNASFQFLASFAPTIKSEIQKTLQSTATAESQIKPSTLTVLRKVSQCLLSKERGYFSQYLDWARSTIIDDLLSCQVVMILLENSRVISCEYITDPWNAFWFCLGWCTLFLIPSIIFAVKTAKHYRPVKNKASSPDFAEMTNLKFPRAQNKYTAPETNLYSSPTF